MTFFERLQRVMRSAWLVVLLFLPAVGVLGQPAQPRALGAPVSELAETSGAIRFVRELRDGRVIIAQSGESPLLVVDSAFQRVTPLGRRGPGPGEYLNPSAIFTTGDTIWVVDGATRRVTSLSMELKLLASVSLQPMFTRDSLVWNVPLGLDTRGRFLVRTHHLRDLGRFAVTQDSVSLVWLDRDSQRPGFLARLRQVPVYGLRGFRVTPSGDTIAALAIDPFTADDAAALTEDGRAVVLRASPYRMEWPGTSGNTKFGPAIEYEKVSITSADRATIQRAHVKSRAAAEGALAQASPRAKIEWAESRWPATKPPFLAIVRPSPRGEIIVQRLRQSTKADTALFDFLSDKTGKLLFQLDLGMRGRLVGVGAKYLYVLRLDEDDVEFLGRYRY